MAGDWRSLNVLANAEVRTALLRCCGSRRWVDGMMARLPFESQLDLMSAADEVWAAVDCSDWLEAFAAHPRIGDIAALREKFVATSDLCGSEQAGVAGAGDHVLHDLAEGNRQYEARFGYIFIVCATGKSAEEMLALLQARLRNEQDEEIKIAAAEQAKITRLRLEKL